MEIYIYLYDITLVGLRLIVHGLLYYAKLEFQKALFKYQNVCVIKINLCVFKMAFHLFEYFFFFHINFNDPRWDLVTNKQTEKKTKK